MMGRITFPFLNFDYEQGFLLTKLGIIHKDLWRWSFYLHITSSLFVITVGFLQFIPALLKRYPKLHRTCGKVYVILVLFLSAPSGLVMGFYANGGMWAKISFVTISILWWVFTLWSYLAVRNGKIQQHIAWMVRSYALTLSALTLRTYVLLLPLLHLDLSAKNQYVLVAWLSWIPNLLLAEWAIRAQLFRKPE